MANNAMLTPNKYLLPDEQAALEQILTRYRFYALRNTTMIMLMLKTGARPQELLNVTWADINFRQKSMFIKTLKGGPPRSLPLTSELCNRLLALFPNRAESPGRVFPITYVRFSQVWHQYRPVKKKLHSLRHTFAVNLYNKCGKLSIVQQALGHAHIHTTSVYLQIEHSIEQIREFIK